MKRACSRGFVLVGLVLLIVFSAGGARAAGVYSGGIFELGDGNAPPGFAGAADIGGSADQAGLDWADVFDAQGNLNGAARGVFLGSDALATALQGSALTGIEDLVGNDRSTDNSIGNAYAYVTRDGSGRVVVFLGVERLSDGAGYVELELDQSFVRLGPGGYGHNVPWKVLGTRSTGDSIVRLDFAAGGLAGVSFYRFGNGGWQFAAGVPGEGCDDAETLCAITNASSIASGPWGSGEIAAGRFVEVGVDLGALLGGNPNVKSLRVRTPDTIAVGYLSGGN